LKQQLGGVSRRRRAPVAFVDGGGVLQLAEAKEGEAGSKREDKDGQS
jgi:hypothetical protein